MAISPYANQLMNERGVAFSQVDFKQDIVQNRVDNIIVKELLDKIYMQEFTENYHVDVFRGLYREIDVSAGRFPENIIMLDFGTGATATPLNLLPPDFTGEYASFQTSFGKAPKNDLAVAYSTYNCNYRAKISLDNIRSMITGAFTSPQMVQEYLNNYARSVYSQYARNKMDKFVIANQLMLSGIQGTDHTDIIYQLKPRNVTSVPDYHTEADLKELLTRLRKLLLDGIFPSDRFSRIDNYTIQLSTKSKIIVFLSNELIAYLTTNLLTGIFNLQYANNNVVQPSTAIGTNFILEGRQVEFHSFNNYYTPAVPGGVLPDGTVIPPVPPSRIQVNGENVIAHLITADAFSFGTYVPFFVKAEDVPGELYRNHFFTEAADFGYNPGTAIHVFTSPAADVLALPPRKPKQETSK